MVKNKTPEEVRREIIETEGFFRHIDEWFWPFKYLFKHQNRFGEFSQEEIEQIVTYTTNLVSNAFCRGWITQEQFAEYRRRNTELLKTEPFRGMFLEHGKKEKELHLDYIGFLEDCVK